MEVSGGVGTIFSRVAVEGPLIKDKASFIVAARRSYIDVLARPFVKSLQNGAGLNFYDLTVKTNYNISQRDHVYLSGFFGRDNFLFDANQGFSWGNTTGTLRWNHIFNRRLFANLTGVYSNYDYHLKFGKKTSDQFTWNSSISNYIFKPELTYFINSRNELSFGAEAIYYTFVPANAVSVSNGESSDISLDKKYNFESAIYAGNSQKIGKEITVDYGLRFSNFNYFGPGSSYSYNDTIPGIRKSPIKEVNYSTGESIATYHNWEPRASFKVQVTPNSSIKGSYNRMAQYLHLISNTTASNPLDVWNPSTNNIKPELANQFTLGYFRSLGKETQYEVSVEGYYRRTQNQIDYIDGADLLLNKYLEGDLLSGIGRAYGVELYAQKKTGRLTGWVSYTLGHTELKVNGINRGNWYSTRYDQRHNLKVAAFYDITKRWSASANFIFVSGTPTTFPTSRYVVQGIPHPLQCKRIAEQCEVAQLQPVGYIVPARGQAIETRQRKKEPRLLGVFGLQCVRTEKSIFDLLCPGRSTDSGRSADSLAGFSAVDHWHHCSGDLVQLQLLTQMKLKSISILFFFATIFSACDTVIHPSLQSADPVYVVDAFINDKLDTQVVKLMFSQPYLEEQLPPWVSGAIVSLSDNEGNAFPFSENPRKEAPISGSQPEMVLVKWGTCIHFLLKSMEKVLFLSQKWEGYPRWIALHLNKVIEIEGIRISTVANFGPPIPKGLETPIGSGPPKTEFCSINQVTSIWLTMPPFPKDQTLTGLPLFNRSGMALTPTTPIPPISHYRLTARAILFMLKSIP